MSTVETRYNRTSRTGTSQGVAGTSVSSEGDRFAREVGRPMALTKWLPVHLEI